MSTTARTNRAKMTVCLDCGSPPLRIDAGGKLYDFEILSSGGLAVLDASGNEMHGPHDRDSFWRAVELWRRQGMKVSEDGMCIYGPVPQRRYRRVGKTMLIQMSANEPDDENTVYRDEY